MTTPTLHDRTDSAVTVLSVSGLSKTFGGVRALRDVGIDFRRGEIHALVGHNGSGKSTLIKVLSGFYQPDLDCHPEVILDGQSTSLNDVHEQLRFVHQDLGLVLELNAVDNIAFRTGFASGAFNRIRWNDQVAVARELVERLDPFIDVTKPLHELTPVQRVTVAVAAALHGLGEGAVGVLVLDEPTAVLPVGEVRRLLEIVESLRDQGVAVLYVSHRLDEVMSIADRITVLRGGQVVITRDRADIAKDELVSLLVDGVEEVRQEGALPVPREDGPPSLRVRRITSRWVSDVDLSLRQGEIVGIAGLPGSGSDELPYAVAGVLPGAGGQIQVDGRTSDWVGIGKAQRFGVAMVPADRVLEGAIGQISIADNLVLSALERRSSIDVTRWLSDLAVQYDRAEQPISDLSGGNQQKVLIGRALIQEPSVLVLCEPTAGVDVGARRNIHDLLIRVAATNDVAILVSTTDIEELTLLCSRVLVMRGGHIDRELCGPDVSVTNIMGAIEGASERGGDLA